MPHIMRRCCPVLQRHSLHLWLHTSLWSHLGSPLQAANPELDMPQILGMMQMAFDSEDPPIQYTHRGGPRPSYETHPMAPGNLTAAAMLAQGQLSDEDDMASAGAVQCPCPAEVQLRQPEPGVCVSQVPACLQLCLTTGVLPMRQQPSDVPL